MPTTNFPQGLTAQGLPVLPLMYNDFMTLGRIMYVDNTIGKDNKWDDAGQGGPDQPFKTLAFAITQARANKGDVVILTSTHAETVGSTGIALNVAGMSVIGLGKGSNRATFTYSAVGSLITVSAANVALRNFRVTASAASTKLFSVTAAQVTFDAVDYF